MISQLINLITDKELNQDFSNGVFGVNVELYRGLDEHSHYLSLLNNSYYFLNPCVWYAYASDAPVTPDNSNYPRKYLTRNDHGTQSINLITIKSGYNFPAWPIGGFFNNTILPYTGTCSYTTSYMLFRNYNDTHEEGPYHKRCLATELGHEFGFLIDNFAQSSASWMGYIAIARFELKFVNQNNIGGTYQTSIKYYFRILPGVLYNSGSYWVTNLSLFMERPGGFIVSGTPYGSGGDLGEGSYKWIYQINYSVRLLYVWRFDINGFAECPTSAYLHSWRTMNTEFKNLNTRTLATLQTKRWEFMPIQTHTLTNVVPLHGGSGTVNVQVTVGFTTGSECSGV